VKGSQKPKVLGHFFLQEKQAQIWTDFQMSHIVKNFGNNLASQTKSCRRTHGTIGAQIQAIRRYLVEYPWPIFFTHFVDLYFRYVQSVTEEEVRAGVINNPNRDVQVAITIHMIIFFSFSFSSFSFFLSFFPSFLPSFLLAFLLACLLSPFSFLPSSFVIFWWDEIKLVNSILFCFLRNILKTCPLLWNRIWKKSRATKNSLCCCFITIDSD